MCGSPGTLTLNDEPSSHTGTMRLSGHLLPSWESLGRNKDRQAPCPGFQPHCPLEDPQAPSTVERICLSSVKGVTVMSPSSSYETWSPRQWSLSLKPSSRLLPELTEPWVPLGSPKVA